MIKIIVAYDKNYGIGADNDLLWQRDLPADLKHFKNTTMSGAIIMGYNTYKSIGRPLPGRKNIVIDRNVEPIEGFEVADCLKSALDSCSLEDQDVFVIGGGRVYEQAVDVCDQIIATEVDATFDQATVYFPEINKSIWREIQREKHLADDDNLYNYDFVVYERV